MQLSAIIDNNADRTLELLTYLGDLLNATDSVAERNEIGFNKADKSGWLMIRGDLLAMKVMLKKYERQLRSRCGDSLIDEVDWTIPSGGRQYLQDAKNKYKNARAEVKKAEKLASQCEARVEVSIESDKGFGLSLTTTGRLDRSRFQSFVAATREIKGRCYPERNYLWIVPFNTNFDLYRLALSSSHIELGEIPYVDEGVKISAGYDVTVSLQQNGKIAVHHPYSDKLNSAYRNSDETSGIIGFDGITKARLIGSEDLSDFDELLSAIRKHQPDWKVGYKFDIEFFREQVAVKKSERRQLPPNLKKLLKTGVTPLPYQVEGYNWYREFDGRALNADEMGLGKTFQTLLYAASMGLKTVVVCPKNVRRNWLQECNKFFRSNIWSGLEIDSSTDTHIDLGSYNIVTINYEILSKFQNLLSISGFDLLVLDESHRIKNPKAKVTKVIQSMAPQFQKLICLSGTPLKNKKSELFTQANLIRPGTYATERELKWSTIFQTKEKLKGFMFRRTKKAELKDLPEKLRTVLSLPGTDLPDLHPDMQIGEISNLKSRLAVAKTALTIEHLEDMLENTDSKIIVFSDSDDACEKIASHFGDRAVLHTGSTTHEKREIYKSRFMDENSIVRLFVATTGSCREGVNLTIADRIVFNDLPFTPADLSQAEARAHRLGQKNCVNVYWVCAEGNSFDARVVEILFQKMAIYEKVINGKKPTPKDEEFLNSPIFSLR